MEPSAVLILWEGGRREGPVSPASSTVSVFSRPPSLSPHLVMGSYASKNKLSIEDMTFLQAKTQLDQVSIQGWYEGFLKDCPSGELTKEQFVEMYSKIFPSGNADNFSKNIFRTFDTNNSGTIDFR